MAPEPTHRDNGADPGRVRVRLLGPVQLANADGQMALGRGKVRSLLALLALHANQVVDENRISDALWGDQPPLTATRTCRSYVSRLRLLLRAAAEEDLRIESLPAGYRLIASPDSIDVHRVERLLSLARAAVTSGDRHRCAQLLAQASREWSGRPLGDLGDEPWALAGRARLEELHLIVLEARADAELNLGRHALMVPELEALCAANPLHERFWAQLIVALYRCGRQADSLRAYQRLREHLVATLGIEPSPELRALESAVLAQDPALHWRAEDVPNPSSSVGTETGLPSGIVTFMLTDIEGSTALWEAYPDAMAAALFRHDEIVAQSVASADGRLIKSKGEGDSTLSVFGRPDAAARAALSLQRAISDEPWPLGLAIKVRVAVHSGEAIERDGDYYGGTVNRAARLRQIARGGDILCSGTTARLISGSLPDGASLVDLGQTRLRDFRSPEHVFVIIHPAERAGDGAPDRPDRSLPLERDLRLQLPSRLKATLPDPGCFADRKKERALLDDMWARARRGERQAVLIGGEPGIGKTALAADLGAAVHSEGGIVLCGMCEEGLDRPYQAVADALTGYVKSCPASLLRSQVGELYEELSRIVPALGPWVAGAGTPVRGDGDAERYRLFDVVAEFIDRIAAQAPVVLVLDDLQWATKPTLLLMKHLLLSTSSAPVAIVGLYRHTDFNADLADVLADLRRVPGLSRLLLGGLDSGGVASMLEASGGSPLDDNGQKFAERLHAETNGSPFFVQEVIRHLSETGTIDPRSKRWPSTAGLETIDLPASISEVVGRRLRRLDARTGRLLQTAAVVGPRFSLELLHDAVEVEDRRLLLDAIDEAVAAGLLSEVPGRQREFRFIHSLVRRAVYDQLSTARRAEMHRRIGEVLEGQAESGFSVSPAALAHHFLSADVSGNVEKAADYAAAAGAEAIERLAYEEAAEYFERALDLLSIGAAGTLRITRCPRLLIGLGEARRGSGDIAGAKEAFAMAADLARVAERPEVLAKAALGYAMGDGGLHRSVGSDPILIELLEEALEAVGHEDSPLRVRLLARLAEELCFSDRHERRLAIAEQAVEMAVRLEDKSHLLVALFGREVCRVGPDGLLEDRLNSSEHLLHLAEELGDRESAYAAHLLRHLVFMEAGNLSAAEAALDAADRIATELKMPNLMAWVTLNRSRQAWTAGRFEEADVLNLRAMQEATSRGGHGELAGLVIGGQAMAQMVHRRSLATMLPVLRDFAREFPHVSPVAKCFLAWVAAEAGELREATETFDSIAHADFSDLSRSDPWMVSMWALVRCCSIIGDVSRATALHDLLRPHQSRWAVDWAGQSFGPVATSLGILTAVLKRFGEAEEHFECAVRLARHAPSPPWEADACYQFALMLRARAGSGDAGRAVELLSHARGIAGRLDMTELDRGIGAAMELQSTDPAVL